jgi:L-amino acid N-acyltransferase YncA
MNDRLRLRPAAGEDLSAIRDIYAHAVLNGTASYEYDPPDEAEMTRRFLAVTSAGFPFIVACSQGVVRGYAYASHFRTRPAYRYLVEDSIYVAPGLQGQGYGTLLLAELMARCEALGFRQMIAVIGDGGVNLASARLHAAMGFSECGRIVKSGFKFGRWCDTLLMQRALGADPSLPPPA